jgi:hypothetical protein
MLPDHVPAPQFEEMYPLEPTRGEAQTRAGPDVEWDDAQFKIPQIGAELSDARLPIRMHVAPKFAQ